MFDYKNSRVECSDKFFWGSARAKFSIALNFRLQAVASLTAVILSGVLGVSLAYYGYGAWSLVMQSLLNNFFNVLLLWLLSKWYPLWCFSWNSFKSLFHLEVSY